MSGNKKEKMKKPEYVNPYRELWFTLSDAYLQASEGKGKERHADGQPFREQPMFWIEENFYSFQLGQAVKKIHESQRLDVEGAVAELEGAIVFLAAHILHLKKEV